MWYVRKLDSENEIYHHGIKGQKWGKKNGPPYPLGASDHSSAERKEGHEGWSKEAKRELDNKNGNKSSNKTKKKSGLTDKQKKYIKIGAAVAVTALATYGGYKLYESGKLDDLISKGKEALNKSFTPKDVKDAMQSMKDDYFKPADGLFNYKQISKLTSSEIKAIRAYTGTPYYRDVNEYLRGIVKEPTAKGKPMADDITSALNKVFINKDVEVQRGIGRSAAESILGKDTMETLSRLKEKYVDESSVIHLDSLVGVTNKDNGVMSTAIPTEPFLGFKKSVAQNFARDGYGIVFDIKAKAGSKGMYVAPLSAYESEHELVFAPGTSLVTDGTIQLIRGIWHIGAILTQ